MDHLCNKFVKDKNTFQAQRQPTFIWNEKRLPMNRLSASVPSCIQKYEQVELLERKPGRLHMTGHQYIFIAGQGGWYQRRVHYRLHDDGPMQWYWKKNQRRCCDFSQIYFITKNSSVEESVKIFSAWTLGLQLMLMLNCLIIE